MDTIRFDRWTRSLRDTPSRRTVLSLVAALGLAATQLPGSVDAKKKHKADAKKRKKKKKKHAASPPPPQSPPTSPPPPPPPPSNPCDGQPNLADCGNGKQCMEGVCAIKPQCHVGDCFGQPLPCCSGVVCLAECPLSAPGQACVTHADCAIDDTCVGFVCQ